MRSLIVAHSETGYKPTELQRLRQTLAYKLDICTSIRSIYLIYVLFILLPKSLAFIFHDMTLIPFNLVVYTPELNVPTPDLELPSPVVRL